MDPTDLAAAVTALLAPHVAKAGEKLPEQIGKLWVAVTEAFKGNTVAEETAKDLLAAPLDADNQAAFRKELKKVLNEHAQFGQQLLMLLQAAQIAQAGSSAGDIFTGDHALKVESNFGTIVYGGDNVQNIGTQINDSTIGGDVTGGDKITSSE